MQNAPYKKCPSCGKDIGVLLSRCPYCGRKYRNRAWEAWPLLFIPVLFVVCYGMIEYQRARDLTPLLGTWKHPKETYVFHADNTMRENWQTARETGFTDRQWYRAGDEIYLGGEAGYWLRCRWNLTANGKTLTLTKYYESGEIITRDYLYTGQRE